MTALPLTGLALVEFTPPELEARDEPVVFFIRTPTFKMRDTMNTILFHAGVIPATKEQSRAILIDGLYKRFDEATADDHATFLEGFWMRQELYEEVGQAWQIQEAQRLFDLAHGAPMRDADPLPPTPYSMREQARHNALVTGTMQEDEVYRAYMARFFSVEAETDDMLMRLFVDHWTGIPVEPARDALGRLTEQTLEDLRRWLHEHTAENAWAALMVRVKAQFGAHGGLEKNLGSLLDTNSNLTGSPAQSGELASSDGSSTGSSTTPTPNSVSPATSPASRNSRSAKTGRKPRTGRTVAPS